MKLLILVLLVYLLYRFVVKPNYLDGPKNQQIEEQQEFEEDEFVDYEEVD